MELVPDVPAGFVHIETIHRSDRSLVHRARREADGQPVILKLLSEPYPELRQIVRLRHEFGTLASLKFAGVPQALELSERGGSPIITVSTGSSGPRLRMYMAHRKTYAIRARRSFFASTTRFWSRF